MTFKQGFIDLAGASLAALAQIARQASIICRPRVLVATVNGHPGYAEYQPLNAKSQLGAMAEHSNSHKPENISCTISRFT